MDRHSAAVLCAVCGRAECEWRPSRHRGVDGLILPWGVPGRVRCLLKCHMRACVDHSVNCVSRAIDKCLSALGHVSTRSACEAVRVWSCVGCSKLCCTLVCQVLVCGRTCDCVWGMAQLSVSTSTSLRQGRDVVGRCDRCGIRMHLRM